MTQTVKPGFESLEAFQKFTGKEALLIDMAGSYGFDKESWDFRLNWALEHENNIVKMVRQLKKDPKHRSEYLKEADEPAMFFGAAQAYVDTLDGKPSGFPISLDATASGMQILALLVSCEASGKMCNLVNTGSREDAYTNVFAAMKHEAQMRGIPMVDITRKQAKQAVMTALYGSEAEPLKCFGDGPLLDVFYHVMQVLCPGAWALNESLVASWEPYRTQHDWVLPDNFHCHVKVMDNVLYQIPFDEDEEGKQLMTEVEVKLNIGTKRGKSLAPNIVHSLDGMVVREIARRCMYSQRRVDLIKEWLKNPNPSARVKNRNDRTLQKISAHAEKSGFLSARVLDLITEKNIGLVPHEMLELLVYTLPPKPFQVISVHDCFRVLPNYANDLRLQYNMILSDMASADMLQFIINQIWKRQDPVTKAGDIGVQVLSANYALS